MSKMSHQIRIKKIDEAKCTGCRACVDSCMMDVIYFDEKKGKPYIRYPKDCQACFLCAIDCPVEAINIAVVDV
jgi:NAD-dependent dihydropyrimidine dehydrogenase PreA subunit